MSSNNTTTSSRKRTVPLLKKVQLHVFKRGLGLPTMDPECLAIQTFCKMIDRRVNTVEDTIVRMDIQNANNKTTFYGVEAIIEQLKSIQPQFDIDSSLNKKNRAKMIAAKSTILTRLLPCVQHYMWINELNYPETREAFCNKLPFHKRLFGPYMIQRRMKSAVNSQLRGTIAQPSTNIYREEIYAIASECLAMINTLLYGKRFLFSDDKPCSLDAILYGCLACLYYPEDMEDLSLKSCLKNYVYVTKFIHSMTDQYYPNYPTMKMQHLTSVKTSVAQIREHRLSLKASYTASILFLIGSAIAVGINFFPGWQNFYILLRNMDVEVIDGSSEEQNMGDAEYYYEDDE